MFASNEEWIEPVRERLDRTRFEATFADFADPGLDFAPFDCVVPLGLSDYAPLRGRTDGKRNFLVPRLSAVELTDNKLQFINHLRFNGFGDYVPAVFETPPAYPFIYKKCRDRAGRNSRIVFSPDELAEFEGTIRPQDYFKQEYVAGRHEFTTHFVSVNGEPVFDTTVQFTFASEHFVRGIRFEPLSTDKVETPFGDIFSRILKELDYSGTSCFNYKVEGGLPKLFEINPRPGGSLRLDLDNYIEGYLAALRIAGA